MNKFMLVLAIVALIFGTSCPNEKKTEVSGIIADKPNMVVEDSFQSILDSVNVVGGILIFDNSSDTYYCNDFDYAGRMFLPASTFKIPNSIIALEIGVMENDSTIIKWDGKPRRNKSWEQDLVFRDAFHYSCVPCYQEIARNIGVENMNSYLEKFGYGNMLVDSSIIDTFWLEGDFGISMLGQMEFIRKFYFDDLGISDRTTELMKKLMFIESEDDFKLSGKTGWSIRNGNNNGWFVGYFETGQDVFFVVTNIFPGEEFNMDMFTMIRKEISIKAFRELQNRRSE